MRSPLDHADDGVGCVGLAHPRHEVYSLAKARQLAIGSVKVGSGPGDRGEGEPEASQYGIGFYHSVVGRSCPKPNGGHAEWSAASSSLSGRVCL